METETIFKVEEPLMEMQNGYGYMGVLLKDKISGKIQCHICGKFFDHLGTHVANKHKVSAKEYKIEYGLPMTFPLVTTKVSAGISDYAKKANSVKNLLKVRKSHSKKWKNKNRTYAMYNINGTCPEQIKEKYVVLSDRIGKQLSWREVKKYDHKLSKAIENRFKTFNNFKASMGMSVLKQKEVWSKEKVINIIRSKYEHLKRIPKPRDFKIPTPKVFKRLFGSWNKALNVAGLV